MMGWYGGMGPLAGLAMFVFWLALLGLILWAVGRLLPGNSGETTRADSESAVEILDRRLANGEIDMHDWQAQRSALMGAQEESAPAQLVTDIEIAGSPSGSTRQVGKNDA
jgi:putative membrane protein